MTDSCVETSRLQETGRAGRDLRRADSIIYYRYSDSQLATATIARTEPGSEVDAAAIKQQQQSCRAMVRAGP